MDSLVAIPGWKAVQEVVFCGMGEPLLRYDCVLEVCRAIRGLRERDVKIRVDTSGLFWADEKRLDVLAWVDILSISLNAENAEKYRELCRPKIDNAYDILMDFLKSMKRAEANRHEEGQHFPEVRLSVVDTSEEELIPPSGRKEYAKGTFPIPNFEECERIASNFGWPLIVKRLFRDSQDGRWNDRSLMELCAQGVSPDVCANCLHRH